MKRLLILIIGVISMPILNAQSISDVVRYSDTDIQGTARFRAMAGAFGALGGDMSAVSLNPAGSAIFNTSHAAFTLSNDESDNQAAYFGSPFASSESNLDFGQAGGVFVFNNMNDNDPWRKVVIGIAYDPNCEL